MSGFAPAVASSEIRPEFDSAWPASLNLWSRIAPNLFRRPKVVSGRKDDSVSLQGSERAGLGVAVLAAGAAGPGTGVVRPACSC